MTASVKIKGLAPGTTFDAGPLDAKVLEHQSDGTTVAVAAGAIGDKPFNTNDDPGNLNDWRNSTLRAYLRRRLLGDLHRRRRPDRGGRRNQTGGRKSEGARQWLII